MQGEGKNGDFRTVVPEHVSLDLNTSALVVIDVTNFDAHPDYAFAGIMREAGVDLSYYWDRVETLLVPNIARMLREFRAQNGRVAFSRTGAQFGDYSDSLRHFRELHRNAQSLRGTEEFEVRDELLPQVGEAIVDKPGSSAFTTGNMDVMLRNAGVESVIFCGVVTNACVLLSALVAYDLGYSVYIVEDACAADSQEIHDAALSIARWLGIEIVTTDQILERIGAVASVQKLN